MPQSKASVGECWQVALSLFDCGPELAERERGSRRTTEKDGGGDEDEAGSAAERMQMDGGDSTKVEAAKRGRLRCTLLNLWAWSTEKNT